MRFKSHELSHVEVSMGRKISDGHFGSSSVVVASPEKVIMIKCRECAKLNEEDPKFCQECGKAL